MDERKQFLKDRNEALLSLDREKILQYMEKYEEFRLSTSFRNGSEEVFWNAVHKAITGCTDLPIEFRRKSKAWLDERGSGSLDDGEL